MNAFFKPWRRKVGVLTLMMACVAMAAWLRSLQVKDKYDFGGGEIKIFHSLETFPSSIMWQRQETKIPLPFDSGWECRPYDISDRVPNFINWDIEWRCQGFGFDFGTGTRGFLPVGYSTNTDATPSSSVELEEAKLEFCVMHYWAVVLSLTLLSAWLLLSKPNPRKLSLEQRANA